MYNGSYDQDYITLKEELDRKRLDDEKAEIILYAADYMTPDRNTLESRVIKTVYDDGKEYHNPVKGIYNEELNNLEKFHSLKDVEEECWCAETFVPEELEEMPCEIFLDDKFLNEKALDEWAKKKELEAEEAETNAAIERRYKYEQEYDKRFEEAEENIESATSDNVKKADDERILKSPPPPVIDGVSIRIEGLDDVTEREAKNYIDLVTKKIQENARKNLSSIFIVKKENGQIELDYSIQHERFERIRRITGYLVGSMDKWNNAKRAEEADRVKHTGGSEKNFASDFKDLCGKYGVSPKKAAQFLANDVQKQSQNNMSR